MTREEILQAVQRYFGIEELVCKHVLAKWGQNAWQFLDTDFLHVLLVVRRDILKAGITCNVGKYTQRGLRCNMCPEVKGKTAVYLSAHILGKAGDFTVSGMTAEQARQKINASAALLPCNVRLEGGVSWLHLDVLPQAGVTDKVYIFKA